jgi:hypothetical protein
MREHGRDQQHADAGVDVLSPLHAVDVGGREREQHHEAGGREQEAAADHGPEHDLLAGVEAPRRRMPVADEAAALPDPADVRAVGMLSLIQTTSMNRRPSMNGQDRKLWAYLAYCDQAAKASGPISGMRSACRRCS